MGYETSYYLEVAADNAEDIIEDAEKTFDCDLRGDVAKWYDYEEDMVNFSKKYPGILFTLRGNGEKWDDIWIAYFLDGKSQVEHAKITFKECIL